VKRREFKGTKLGRMIEAFQQEGIGFEAVKGAILRALFAGVARATTIRNTRFLIQELDEMLDRLAAELSSFPPKKRFAKDKEAFDRLEAAAIGYIEGRREDIMALGPTQRDLNNIGRVNGTTVAGQISVMIRIAQKEVLVPTVRDIIADLDTSEDFDPASRQNIERGGGRRRDEVEGVDGQGRGEAPIPPPGEPINPAPGGAVGSDALAQLDPGRGGGFLPSAGVGSDGQGAGQAPVPPPGELIPPEESTGDQPDYTLNEDGLPVPSPESPWKNFPAVCGIISGNPVCVQYTQCVTENLLNEPQCQKFLKEQE